MNKNILTVLLPVFATLFISGCAATSGPKVKVEFAMAPGYVEVDGCQQGGGLYQPTQREANDLAHCLSVAPEVEKTYDIVAGYWFFEGEGEEKMRECLISKHGWKKLDPSKCLEGTMASPYPLQPYR
jgi:hypothetical protein